MSMTRKDYNLIAVTLRDLWPRKFVINDNSSNLRFMQTQHVLTCKKLANELDAANANFSYSKFMEVAGFDCVAGLYVVKPYLSVTTMETVD